MPQPSPRGPFGAAHQEHQTHGREPPRGAQTLPQGSREGQAAAPGGGHGTGGELGCAREPLNKGLRPHILPPSIASSFPGTGQLRAKATSALLCHRLSEVLLVLPSARRACPPRDEKAQQYPRPRRLAVK